MWEYILLYHVVLLLYYYFTNIKNVILSINILSNNLYMKMYLIYNPDIYIIIIFVANRLIIWNNSLIRNDKTYILLLNNNFIEISIIVFY